MSLKVSIATDEKELTEIFKLRYRVYCQEWGFDKQMNHSSEIIKDSFDEKAIHFVARDESHSIVGAIMLILNSPEGYPIERHCDLTINKDELPRDNLAEIARLVIHRDYRRRAEDKYIYGHDEDRRSIGSYNFQQNYLRANTGFRRADDKFRHKQGGRRPAESYSDRRRRHELLINLFKAVYHESKRRDITHWYSFFTKGILMLLNSFGFDFREIGDPVDYHGICTPYLTEIDKVEQEMESKNSELYNEFIKEL